MFSVGADLFSTQLTVDYATRLLKELEPVGVYWFEEALHPDDYEGYAALKRVSGGTMITTGEHEYTRYGFRQLLTRNAAGTCGPLFSSAV